MEGRQGWEGTFAVPITLAGRLGDGAELDVGAALVQELNCLHCICALAHTNDLPTTTDLSNLPLNKPFQSSRHVACIFMPLISGHKHGSVPLRLHMHVW